MIGIQFVALSFSKKAKTYLLAFVKSYIIVLSESKLHKTCHLALVKYNVWKHVTLMLNENRIYNSWILHLRKDHECINWNILASIQTRKYSRKGKGNTHHAGKTKTKISHPCHVLTLLLFSPRWPHTADVFNTGVVWIFVLRLKTIKFMTKPPIHRLSIIHLTTVNGKISESVVLNP